MPIIFKDENLTGKVEFNEDMEQIKDDLSGYYCDGGIRDNLPISCLIKDMECDTNKFIVVHLDNDSGEHKKEKFLGSEMVHIFPSVKFYGLLSTVNFSREKINDLIEIGYKDAKEQLYDYFSKRENHVKNNNDELHYANGEFYNSIADVYDSKIYEKPLELGGEIVSYMKNNNEIKSIEDENKDIVINREYRTDENKFVEFNISRETLISNIIVEKDLENQKEVLKVYNDKNDNMSDYQNNIQILAGKALSLAKDLEGKTIIMNNVMHDEKEFYFDKKDRNEYFFRSSLYESFAGKDEAKRLDKANRKKGLEYIAVTPNVVVFRDENLKKTDEVYTVSFESVYPLTKYKDNRKDFANNIEDFKQRVKDSLQVAASMKYENILINEWGIDEDGTNAEEVASCFYEILISEKYAEFFKNIIFNFENPIQNIPSFIQKIKEVISVEQYEEYHWLINNLKTEKKEKVCAFDENSKWSIFLERPFKFEGIEFKSVFQCMQYKKALIYGDKLIAKYILKTNDKKKMRHYFKADVVSTVKYKKHWNAVKQNIMIECLKVQIENYPELKEELKSTENTTIIFCTKDEKKYGIVAKTTDEDLDNQKKWKGNNKLGYALMSIRDNLQ